MNHHLDWTLEKQLLDLLAPLLDRSEDRRGLLTLALGADCPVLNQIDYSGAVGPFILNMTQQLADFGELRSGTTALWAVLETVREQVGVDRQDRIDRLRPFLQTSMTATPQPTAAVPPHPLHLRVFLASPGDVARERVLALKVLEQLQYDPLLRGRITIETVAWDKSGAGTPMLATLSPQAAIAQGLPKPSQCDIVIVVLWSRMGTPLPLEWKKPDGSPYLSGTEWEYLDALEAAEQHGKPDILVYRCNTKPPLDVDDADAEGKLQQWKQVKQFFANFGLPDGSIYRG